MDVRNCRSCGKLFNYFGGPQICPVCREKLEDKFQQVKEYIRENPKATIQEIVDENDVTTQQLHQWIREERLEFSKDSPIQLQCENCGAPIRTGRFCEKCKANMVNGLNSAFERPKPKAPERKMKATDEDRMRFLHRGGK